MAELDTFKAIDAAIRGIAKTGTTLRGKVQDVAVAIIRLGEVEQGEARNAPNKALALCLALGGGIRADSLARFFSQFSPIAVDVKAGKAGLRAKEYKKGDKAGQPNPNYRDWNGDGAAATMWWEVKAPAKAEAAFDWAAAKALADRLAKAFAKAKEGEAGVNDAADIDALCAAINKEIRRIEMARANRLPGEEPVNAPAEEVRLAA